MFCFAMGTPNLRRQLEKLLLRCCLKKLVSNTNRKKCKNSVLFEKEACELCYCAFLLTFITALESYLQK